MRNPIWIEVSAPLRACLRGGSTDTQSALGPLFLPYLIIFIIKTFQFFIIFQYFATNIPAIILPFFITIIISWRLGFKNIKRNGRTRAINLNWGPLTFLRGLWNRKWAETLAIEKVVCLERIIRFSEDVLRIEKLDLNKIPKHN